MEDEQKSKQQLIEELVALRQQLAVKNHPDQPPQALSDQQQLADGDVEQPGLPKFMYWAGVVLSSTLNFEKVLDRSMEQVGRIVPYTAACIMLVEGKHARIFRWRGYNNSKSSLDFTNAAIDITKVPMLRTVHETGWPLATPYVETTNEWLEATGQSWIQSSLSIPIRTRNRMIGFIQVDANTLGFYTQENAEHLNSFANQAAVALENARLYDRARQEIAQRVIELKTERNFVSAILETTSALVYVVDITGRVARFNKACEQLTGYTFAEVHRRFIWDICMADAQIGRLQTIFLRLQSGEYPIEYETYWVSKNQQQQLIAWSSTVLFDNTGRVVHLVSTGIDITGRRQVESERERLIEELEAFSYTVAHDLQDPLAINVGFADALLHNHTAIPLEELENHLHTIAQNSHRMSNIVDELLILTGVRQQEIEPRQLNMANIVEEAQRRLYYMIQEYQAQVLIPTEWPVAIGHAPWVVEVWVNYISNALKYGGRPPHIELGASLQPGGIIRFWVKDNGLGLLPEEQAQLFRPFSRLNQIRVKGYGLGLSIVRRIVEKLGGTTAVTSPAIPGQGTVFSFTLPAAPNGKQPE